MGKYYLIEIELGHSFVEHFSDNESSLNRLLAEGKVQTYGISNDFTRMWATMIAETELEVWEMLTSLPFDSVMEPLVTPLYTYNQSIDLHFPIICLN